MPSPSDQRSASVLQAVYDLLVANDRWPTFGELDHHLDQRNEPAAEDLVISMPAGLVYGVGAGSRPIRDEQQIALSAAGLAAVPTATDDLSAFLQVVAEAARLEAARQSPSAEIRLTTTEVRRLLGLRPSQRRSTSLLRRLRSMLNVEHCGWTQFSGDENWSFTFDRRVRRFRNVSSVSDYWSRAHPDPVLPSAIAPASDAALVAASPSASPGWAALLHRTILEATWSRISTGHLDDAVEEAWKVVASHLRGQTGLSSDGVQLVNRALGSRGMLVLADTDTPQGVNDQEGHFHLARGLVQAGRNVRAHRLSEPGPAEADAATFILLASYLLGRLEAGSETDQ